MRLVRSRTRTAAEIPTSSMADIAFLLLIFFLVTTVFDEERGLQLVLPEDATVDVAESNLLFLLVGEDGMVEIMRGESPHVQRVQPNEIRSLWRREVAANANLIAAVKTAPGAPYGAMVNVLDALQSAGASRISLGVLER